MKITTILLTVLALQVSAGSVAQISISGREVTLKRVFAVIKKQAGFHVFYDENDLASARKVTVDFHNASVITVLDECLKGQPLEYSIRDKNIFIKRKMAASLNNDHESSFRIDKILTRVSGKVVNQNNDPVQGATVTEKGTSNATSTLGDGSFALMVEKTSAILLITGANIDPYEYKLQGQSIVVANVNMKVGVLDQVQVVAYGTNTQRYQVGSVAKITSEEIASQPVSNPLSALSGRAAGLVVSQTSGIPGSSFKIQIRGQNSLRPTTTGIVPYDNPLIIVDGVPFAANNNNLNSLQSLGSPGEAPFFSNPYGGISPLNSINPSDIESIEILRDADATAIYGSRGANGVVLITTKKAKSGTTKVSVSAYTGQSEATRLTDMLHTKDYLAIRREAMQNAGVVPDVDNAQDLLLFDSTKYTDWKEYFLGGVAKTYDANVNVSGGSATTKFKVGTGYHKETFIFPGDFSDNRLSVSSNFHHNSVNSRFSVDLTALYSYGKNNSAGRAEPLTAFTLAPNHPDLIDPDGNLVWDFKGAPLFGLGNPIKYLMQEYVGESHNLISRLQLSYAILPDLTISSSLGYNSIRFDEVQTNPRKAQDPQANPLGASTFGNSDIRSWILEPQIEYRKAIKKAQFSVMIGSTFQKNITDAKVLDATGYTNDLLLRSLYGASHVELNHARSSVYKYSSLFSRLSFRWDNKYLLSLNARRDASSRFGPGRRVGDFGSVGAGWIFSEEKLVKRGFSALSYGKLRFSYGTTGSDAIGDYQFVANWRPYENAYENGTGYNPINLYNPDYSWAINKKTEIGLELGFLRDKLLVTAALYRNRCGNQLVSYNLPSQTGFKNVVQNFPAVVENSGLELQMTYNVVRNKDFQWMTSANVSFPRNKLVSFPGIESSSYASEYIVGQPLSAREVFRFNGVDPATGLFTFQSKAGGSTSAPDLLVDRSVVVNVEPKLGGGIRNLISYKNVSLDLFIEFRKQKGVNYYQSIYSSGAIGTQINLPSIIMRRWQKPGDKTDIQQVYSEYSGAAYDAAIGLLDSDGIYSDASFVRFKTVSLAYSIPSPIIRKLGMEQFKVFMNAQNLFTITHYKGNDPENQNYYAVPPMRTIVLGLQVNL